MPTRPSPIHASIDASLLDLISSSILYELAEKKTQMLPINPTLPEVEAYRRDNMAEMVWRKVLKWHHIPFSLSPHPTQMARTRIGGRKCLPYILPSYGAPITGQNIPSFYFSTSHPIVDRNNGDALVFFCTTTSERLSGQATQKPKWAYWQFNNRSTLLPPNGGNIGIEIKPTTHTTITVEGLNQKLELSKEDLQFTDTVRVRHTIDIYTQLRVVHCGEITPPTLIGTSKGAVVFSIQRRQWCDIRGKDTAMTIWGYLNGNDLRQKLNAKMDLDTEYRIAVYQSGNYTISGLELSPVSQLFDFAKIHDK